MNYLRQMMKNSRLNGFKLALNTFLDQMCLKFLIYSSVPLVFTNFTHLGLMLLLLSSITEQK